MFKSFSKLMLLAIGVLTVFSACSEDESGGSTPHATFIGSVGGKEFNLVTGTKNPVSKQGNIMSPNGEAILYTFVKEDNPSEAIYSNSTGNFFGVVYETDEKPLDFYFAKTTAKPNGDYWDTAADVKFTPGEDSLLATVSSDAVFAKGNFNDNITTIEDEVPTVGAISTLFNKGMGELLVLADNKTSGGKGTLYRGSVTGTGITITGTQLPTGILNSMTTESLQLIGTEVYIVTKGEGTEDSTDNLTIYTAEGVETSVIDNVTADSYAISAGSDATGFYIATSDKDSTVVAAPTAIARVRKVSGEGVVEAPVALKDSASFKPISITVIGDDFYVASMSDATTIIRHKNTEKLNPNVVQTNNSGELVIVGTDAYLIYENENKNKMNTVVNNSVVQIKGAELPMDILSVKGSDSVLYVTARTSGTSTTTTAYTIKDAILSKSATVTGTDITTNGVTVGVTPSIIALPEMGVLVIDAGTIATKNVIRYNHFLTVDAPFKMPSIN